MNMFLAWKSCNGDIREFYKQAISIYEREIWGYKIAIRREELSEHSRYTKRDNINSLKKELHKSRYNLTRTKTLLRKLDEPPVLNYDI